MNLLEKIKSYLTKRADWVHVHEIYTKASQHGYTTEAIKNAIDTISHTPPFASWQVSSGDYRANKVSGTWLRRWDMSPEELERNMVALVEFESI
jgi:hypothetical protein